MNSRVIKINGHKDIESLKVFILQKLNLVDYKNDYVVEFDDRLKGYINRNEHLEIVFQFDREKLEKDLKFNLSLTNKATQPYPENFEMGNPHNRWFFDPIPKTADDIEKEEIEMQKSFQDSLMLFKNFLDKLEQLGNGRIIIKES